MSSMKQQSTLLNVISPSGVSSWGILLLPRPRKQVAPGKSRIVASLAQSATCGYCGVMAFFAFLALNPDLLSGRR